MKLFKKIRECKMTFNMNFFVALIPLLVVGGLLLFEATGFGIVEPSGDIDPRLPLIIGAISAAILAKLTGTQWKEVEEGISKSLSGIASTFVMLITIGILIATLMISGIVPSVIYYGIGIIRPEFILPLSFILTGLVSLTLGSSWTTAAVIGVPLVMIGKEIGTNPEWVIGAVISGSYLGDKLSPLSDTTSLAAGVSGVTLFDHIKAMLKPTGIAAGAALIGFIILGFASNGASGTVSNNIEIFQNQLSIVFPVLSPALIIPLLLIIPIFKMKLPTIPALLIIAVIAIIIAFTVQGLSLQEVMGAVVNGRFVDEANAPSEIAGIVTSVKGIDGMMWTITIVICAMVFGGTLQSSGIIHALIRPIRRLLERPRTLVFTTGIIALLLNALTADQYTALSLPPEFLGDKYNELEVDKTVLSQTLEGVGTVSSPLIMWSSCGAFMYSQFGGFISGWGFVVFCFFNIASIAIALFGPLLGFFVTKKGAKLID